MAILTLKVLSLFVISWILCRYAWRFDRFEYVEQTNLKVPTVVKNLSKIGTGKVNTDSSCLNIASK